MTNQYNFGPEQFFNADAFKSLTSGYNQEAFSKASRETVETAKAIVQCQTNYAREQMEDVAAFWRNWMSSGSNIQDKVEIQNQAASEGFAKAMAHNKELTAIVQKSQEKILREFGSQVSETINTAKKAATKSKK